MPRSQWLMAMVVATGCAAAPPMMHTTDQPTVEVRNYEGEVLPPYALSDADDHVEVECLDGRVYEIVDRPQDLYGASNKKTSHARSSSTDDICDRILDYRTERRTR